MAEENKLKLNKEQLDMVAGGSKDVYNMDSLRNRECKRGGFCEFDLVWSKVNPKTGERVEQLYSCRKCNCEVKVKL